jgi:class 3 adenylate cyclase
MSALFAATYPERVSHLVLIGGFARAADRVGQDIWDANLPRIIRNWGTGELLKVALGGQAADDGLLARVAKLERLSSSPGAFKEIMLLNRQIDVRPILPTVRVPTLVLHRATDAQMPVRLGRDLASKIPGVKYIEYPDGDHAFWTGDVDTTLGDIEEFVTGHRETPQDEFERVLATVLFTDIVDSTRRAVASGDHTWRQLLDRHDELARETIEKHRGVLVKTTGDGILATFDGPGRAVRCALMFGAASQKIGLPVRAGLHTGEIEIRGNDIGGVAVHAAARVMAQSQPSEVLVSRVITDLVAGAGLKFAERGSHELKGLPGRWDLFAASV